MKQVEEILEKNELYLSVMKVDEVEVYQEFQEYLIEHIASVKTINVEVQTLKQVMDESVISLQSYLDGALLEIKKLADEFYQGAGKESWNKLNQLLEALLWISQTIETVQNKQVYQNASDYKAIAASLREEFANLECALTDQDMVLTGDIIKYEIIAILDQLLGIVTTTIDNEVARHDLS
ncbi:hypothetical protein E1757_26550 [Paenibacillus piri]|uniref:Chemotaxis protein n=1 Tax=Paenibacillus piri TaxID=2547395 RepID=A0A4R5KE51_9BACL|nr:hypothetical protein E1757_26550 [Paenibacillus piri]